MKDHLRELIKKMNFADHVLKNGACGGKLVGAGGGGFLMFYCKDKKRLRNEMNKFVSSRIKI